MNIAVIFLALLFVFSLGCSKATSVDPTMTSEEIRAMQQFQDISIDGEL